MRRFAWLLLLPVVWIPLLVLIVFVAQVVPWWALAFGAVFWFALRRRLAGGGAGLEVDPDGARYSPVRGRGGF